MSYEILASDWLTAESMCLGIVAIKRRPDSDEWKCYIGIASGYDEKVDEQHIAAHGAKLMKDVACAWFPHLNPDDWRS